MVPDFVSLIIFLLALGGMIFVHELGHFIAARWAGIEVEEFGLGLPSYKLATLFKWQGTEFTIYALLLGGFIRPKGENDPNVPGTCLCQPVETFGGVVRRSVDEFADRHRGVLLPDRL